MVKMRAGVKMAVSSTPTHAMKTLLSDNTTHPNGKAIKQRLRAGFCLLVCLLLAAFGSASAQVPPFVLHHSMPAPADVQYGAHFASSSGSRFARLPRIGNSVSGRMIVSLYALSFSPMSRGTLAQPNV